jgi:hypothetical protein
MQARKMMISYLEKQRWEKLTFEYFWEVEHIKHFLAGIYVWPSFSLQPTVEEDIILNLNKQKFNNPDSKKVYMIQGAVYQKLCRNLNPIYLCRNPDRSSSSDLVRGANYLPNSIV